MYEAELLREDMKRVEMELSAKIESSSLRLENNLKSEINRLKIRIIAAMFVGAALFPTLAKLFFDK